MKFAVAVGVLMGVSICCTAQTYEIVGYEEGRAKADSAAAIQPPNSVNPAPAQSPIINSSQETPSVSLSRPPGMRMRNTGRFLTIMGGALLTGGVIVLSSADETYYNTYQTSNGTYSEGDPQAALGVLMIMGGAGMAVPGIIFWSKGAKKYNRYLRRKEALAGFNAHGVSLQYRF